jgi:hypothetical protein
MRKGTLFFGIAALLMCIVNVYLVIDNGAGPTNQALAVVLFLTGITGVLIGMGKDS